MPEPVRSGQRYMPGLDGLRALAVLAVIAYHEQFGWAPGGMLGVGVFFTLSGYLITSLLWLWLFGLRQDQVVHLRRGPLHLGRVRGPRPDDRAGAGPGVPQDRAQHRLPGQLTPSTSPPAGRCS